MRYLIALFVTLVVAACSKAPATRNDADRANADVVQFLITSAAMDFHTHGPAGLVRVRDVRLGRVASPTGEDRYMLCGQFLSAGEAGNANWIPFVTIKTSGYEQYVGAQAHATHCQSASVTWDKEAGDLTSLLQSRLDSLGSTGSQAPLP